MTRPTFTRCAIDGCYTEHRHLKDCDDRTCPGCVPGEAADGLLICLPHRNFGVRALRSLPSLDAELLTAYDPYNSPQAPKPEGAGSGEHRDAIRAAAFGVDDNHPGPFELRQEIYEALSNACGYIITERHRPGHRAGILPSWDVPRMVAYLLKFADWMSADPVQAQHWPFRFDNIAYDARRAAQAARTSGVYLGACPQTVAKDGAQVVCGGPIRKSRDDDTGMLTCPWCKTTDTAWWWVERINPTSRKIRLAPAKHVAAILSQKYFVDLRLRDTTIDEYTIRRWSSAKVRGQHRPTCVDEDCVGCQPRIDPVACSIKTQRLLYDVAQCEEQAVRAYQLVAREDEAA